ncbi:MAG: lysophospholipid acyltransferase family protein [Campylobacterota bacterium]|nr:lysophospholipid acyltransferase family protein [Campylobacterota bacterium]
MIISKIRAFLTLVQLVVSVSIVIVLMYIFKNNNKVIRTRWAAMQLKLLGIQLEIKGTLDPDAQILAMNHQSILDIIVFEYLHPKDQAWVAKKEIAKIPWFGHILKAPDMIIVERESKSSLVKLLKDTKEKLNQNRPIAIFPEGTRTDGKKIRKFKAGAKIIAEKYDLDVQPVVLVGTRDIFDSQNFLQKSGVVKIVYLPTVKASKTTTWYKDMEDDMSKILKIESESAV